MTDFVLKPKKVAQDAMDICFGVLKESNKSIISTVTVTGTYLLGFSNPLFTNNNNNNNKKSFTLTVLSNLNDLYQHNNYITFYTTFYLFLAFMVIVLPGFYCKLYKNLHNSVIHIQISCK